MKGDLYIMDGVMSDGRKGKLWMCRREHGHALGIVIDSKLLLFRSALVVPSGVHEMALPMMRGKGFVEGTMRDIECELCESKRTWYMSEKAVAQLLGPLYGDAVEKSEGLKVEGSKSKVEGSTLGTIGTTSYF